MKHKRKMNFWFGIGITASISLGIGLGLGLGVKESSTLLSESEVLFHYGTTTKSIDIEEYFEILDTIDYTKTTKGNNEISLYEDVTEGPTDPENPDGPTDPDTPPPEGPSDSITSLEAKWLTIGFMSASLTGDIDGQKNTSGEYEDDSIFSDTYTTTTMTDDEYINNFDSLFTDLIEIKLFLETTGSPSGGIKFRDYMLTLLETTKNDELKTATIPFIEGSFKTFFEAKSNDVDEWNALITALKNDINYHLDIVDFIYSYSWLWRPYWSSSFDYNLTEILVTSKPALIWEMNLLDLYNLDNGDRNTINLWKTNEFINISEWNSLIGDNANNWVTGDKYSLLTDGGAKGFSGIKFNSEAIANTEDNLWKYSNLFDHEDVESNDDDYAIPNAQFENIINGRITPYVNKSGDIILEEPETGLSGSVVGVSLLYPYVFAENFNGNDADNWKYRISAYKDSNDFYRIDDAHGGTRTTWFNEIQNMVGVDLNLQLLLLYSIYNSQKDKIQNSTYNYWNNKGFYIELTGKYKEKYGSLIDTRLQKK